MEGWVRFSVRVGFSDTRVDFLVVVGLDWLVGLGLIGLVWFGLLGWLGSEG